MKLNNNTDIDLNVLIDTRLLVQANSGGGKSWLIRRLLEQSHGQVQQIVIDLEGEFSTLREKFDYVLCGADGDTPADTKGAAVLAKKLLELNVSAIVDLYELEPQERKHFVKLFLDALINAPKELWHPVLIVIDEAHFFCPEKGQSEAMQSVINLCAMGRKRGFCAVLATQRLSKLHKDAAAECNNKLIGRTGLDVDMKRAYDELGFNTKEQYLSLRSLEAGEFFAFGPAMSSEVIKVTVGEVLTTHPKAGSRILVTPPSKPSEKISKILSALADIPKEAKKETDKVEHLERKVVDLNYQLRIAQSGKPTLSEEQINQLLEQKLKPHLIAFQSVENAYKNKIQEWKDYSEKVMRVAFALSSQIKDLNPPSESVGASYAPIKPIITVHATEKALADPILKEAVIDMAEKAVEQIDKTISNPEQRILDAIAWMESINITEPNQVAVAFLAGYKFGAGGFNNPRGALRVKGLVEYRGDKIVLTESGRLLANTPETILTQEELHIKVLGKLPGPEQRLLKPLLDVYPAEMTNEELASQASYAPNAGGFNNPKGRLRTLGLIEYTGPGRVKASEILFI